MNARTIRTAMMINDWATAAYYRATTWRTAVRLVQSQNPTAEASIRIMRRCMRDAALDAVTRAKYAIRIKEAA